MTQSVNMQKLSPNQGSPGVGLRSPFNILAGLAGPPDLGSGLLEICGFVLNMLLLLSSILMCPAPICSPPPRRHSGGGGGPLRFGRPSPPQATRRRRWPKAVRATPQYIPQAATNTDPPSRSYLYFQNCSDAKQARALNDDFWGRDYGQLKINCSFAKTEMVPSKEHWADAKRLRG